MKKKIAIGITVLTMTAACMPLTARAAGSTQFIKPDCIKWGVIIWNGNCPELPGTPVIPETPEASEKSFAERVVELVNVERAKEGLAPLTIEEKLEQAALVRAKEIQSSFSHTRPDGSSFATAIREAGMSYRTAGENIAWGQKTPEEVVKAWMNSPSHRANIMKSSFSKIGVGHLQNKAGTSYWVQLFTN